MFQKFYFQIKGRKTAWVAALLFGGVGIIFAYLIPGFIIEPDFTPHTTLPKYLSEHVSLEEYNRAAREVWEEEQRTLPLIFSILGYSFVFLGSAVFLMAFFRAIVMTAYPEREGPLNWWISFISGIIGALLFSLPSSLLWPIYFFLPPTGKAAFEGKMFIVWIFTAAGWIVNIALIFIGRRIYLKQKKSFRE